MTYDSLYDAPATPSAFVPSAWDRHVRTTTDVTPQRRVIEGARGLSVRASIYLRYAQYALTLLACSALVQGLLHSIPSVNNGGVWMLFSGALIVVTAALGTFYFPNHRNEIIQQFRHFLFGISLFPGTGIAVLLWAMRGTAASSTTSVLSSAFTNALPLLFFATVIIPALIFIKVIAGMRQLHRSRLDDQEAIALWTRQDSATR